MTTNLTALSRSDAALVRLGDSWGVVWSHLRRWYGRIIKAVTVDTAAAEFGVPRATIWWTAPCEAERRRDVIDHLLAEAQ